MIGGPSANSRKIFMMFYTLGPEVLLINMYRMSGRLSEVSLALSAEFSWVSLFCSTLKHGFQNYPRFPEEGYDGAEKGKHISCSAHWTTNFPNSEFQFPQFKVLQSVFVSYVESCIGIIWLCIVILEVRGQAANVTQTTPDDNYDDWNTNLPVPTFWNLKVYPNPQTDIDKCGRGGNKSWVCDPNNILTTEEGRLFSYCTIFCCIYM